MTKRSVRSALAGMGLVAVAVSLPTAAFAASDPYVGEVIIVPYTFCPSGFVEANGSLRSISQETVLFALYGTTFGGDGVSTFQLPDLRGRVPINAGTGPGLSSYVLGQTGGAQSFTLTINNLPTHTHSVNATNSFSDKPGPGGKFLGADNTGFNKYHDGPANKTMDTGMLAAAGGSQPVGKLDPFLAVRFCVAPEGVFPPRD